MWVVTTLLDRRASCIYYHLVLDNTFTKSKSNAFACFNFVIYACKAGTDTHIFNFQRPTHTAERCRISTFPWTNWLKLFTVIEPVLWWWENVFSQVNSSLRSCDLHSEHNASCASFPLWRDELQWDQYLHIIQTEICMKLTFKFLLYLESILQYVSLLGWGWYS